MSANKWVEDFPGAITVCDTRGIIVEMNSRAAKTFEKDGGIELIGKNVLDCHPEPARSKLQAIITEGTRNVYTIEKNGVKKFIFQSPWYEAGRYAGIVELSLEIPRDIPHFVRES